MPVPLPEIRVQFPRWAVRAGRRCCLYYDMQIAIRVFMSVEDSSLYKLIDDGRTWFNLTWRGRYDIVSLSVEKSPRSGRPARRSLRH